MNKHQQSTNQSLNRSISSPLTITGQFYCPNFVGVVNPTKLRHNKIEQNYRRCVNVDINISVLDLRKSHRQQRITRKTI